MGLKRRAWIANVAGWALGGLTQARALAQTPTAPAAPTVSAAPVAVAVAASEPAFLPTEWAAAWQQIQQQGSARFTVWGLHVYDAQLWVQPGWTAERYAQSPLILDLLYARSLSGEGIAERSLTEMKRNPRMNPAMAQPWLKQMKALFPDVKGGDRLTGWLIPGQAARFALNRRPLGEVPDPLFAELFFGIWLAPQTSEPALRRALIGAERLSGRCEPLKGLA